MVGLLHDASPIDALAIKRGIPSEDLTILSTYGTILHSGWLADHRSLQFLQFDVVSSGIVGRTMQRLIFSVLVALGTYILYQPASAQTVLTRAALVEEIPGEFRAPPVGTRLVYGPRQLIVEGVAGIEIGLLNTPSRTRSYDVGWMHRTSNRSRKIDVSKVERFFPLAVGKKMELKTRVVLGGDANYPIRSRYEGSEDREYYRSSRRVFCIRGPV